MPLIEEKTGFGSFRLTGQTLSPLRELFHATVATKPQRSPRFFTTVPVLVSKKNMVPLQFSRDQESWSWAFGYLTKPCDLNDLISKTEQAVSRKKDRETKILDARMKPYISERERDELISRILDIKQ